ncbi:hypothetical protein BDW22DRAFT_173340 [Trametopsis cervina]|nr:hypothetical protein BDW22DRAFT_173340 [Trametopsis cervina]
MCFSWWFSTFPCLCVLYYAGQVVGPPPQYGVCLASASLTIAQSILVATTGPALIFHIWMVVRNAVSSRSSGHLWITRSTFFCLALPYFAFLATATIALFVGLRHPNNVHRVKFYCVVDEPILTKTISVVGAIFVAVAIILEVWTILILYRNRTVVQQLSREGFDLDIPLILRVCVFGLYVFLGLCLEAVAIFRWTSPISDLFFSTFGLAVFVVFGTQPSIWRLWRQTSRQAAGTLAQFKIPYQLHPRPSLHHITPFPLDVSPVNQPLVTPAHSRHVSYSRYSSHTFSHGSRSLRRSYARSSGQYVQSLSPLLPALPSPVMYRASQDDETSSIIMVSPAFTNDLPYAPTNTIVPDYDTSHLDYGQKLGGELIQELPASPPVYDFARSPRAIQTATPHSSDREFFDRACEFRQA